MRYIGFGAAFSWFSTEARRKVHRFRLRPLEVLQERPNMRYIGCGSAFFWFFKKGPTKGTSASARSSSGSSREARHKVHLLRRGPLVVLQKRPDIRYISFSSVFCFFKRGPTQGTSASARSSGSSKEARHEVHRLRPGPLLVLQARPT